MNGIRQLVKKEISSYKPSDIWTNEDHILFLKYCPKKRDKCYHAVALDTSARPHEILSLKIKEIKFRVSTINNSIVEGENDNEGIIEAIPKDKAEDLVEIIRSSMQDNRRFSFSKKQKLTELDKSKEDSRSSHNQQSVSIADGLQKLARLKEEGVITEEEFIDMKKEIIRNSRK